MPASSARGPLWRPVAAVHAPCPTAPRPTRRRSGGKREVRLLRGHPWDAQRIEDHDEAVTRLALDEDWQVVADASSRKASQRLLEHPINELGVDGAVEAAMQCHPDSLQLALLPS